MKYTRLVCLVSSMSFVLLTGTAGLADTIRVMYAGKIVEVASVEELFNSPLHPYTEALISAIPEPEPNLDYHPQTLKGDLLNVINQPSGCVFRSLCPLARADCAAENWGEQKAGAR